MPAGLPPRPPGQRIFLDQNDEWAVQRERQK
jgi:hypothetical protein